MLAATITDTSKIKFPVIGSAKLDGYRGVIPQGELVSRKLRPFDNEFTTKWFSQSEFAGMDGELIRGEPNDVEVFSKTSSACRTVDKRPRISFHVFDDFSSPLRDYVDRWDTLRKRVAAIPVYSRVYLLPQKWLNNLDELEEFESKLIDEGFEGAIFRSPRGKYKFGRSTMNEQYLMKLKRFEKDSARIIGFEEEMQNNNPATINALGKTKRTKHAENMVGKNTLGAFIAVVTSGPYKGKEITCTGITKILKAHIWANQDKFLRKGIIFKWFPIGSQDLPRHPTFEDFI